MVRQLGFAVITFVFFIGLLVVGFSSTQTGWIALALMCVWPFLWAVVAWSVRGLKDTYQLVPKPKSAHRTRSNEVLG